MNYDNPIPVAVALVRLSRAGRKPALLGVVRARAPGKGGLAFPGGYVDHRESAEAAAARELLEETGIETAVTDWIPRATRITPENRLLIFCELRMAVAEAILQSFTPNDEVLALRPIEADTRLIFGTHQDIAEGYFSNNSVETELRKVA